MEQSENDCLLLVVGEDYLKSKGTWAKVGVRIDAAVGVGLSAPEGTERNIEEVGQAGIPVVSAMATVGCLEGWRMALMEGMSWRSVSAPSVSAFSPQDSSSSPSQSSFDHLIDMQHETSVDDKESYNAPFIRPWMHGLVNADQDRSPFNLDVACIRVCMRVCHTAPCKRPLQGIHFCLHHSFVDSSQQLTSYQHHT